MNVWTTIIAAGLGSYVLRMSMISTDRLRLPSQLDGAASLVAPAAFTALAVSSLAALALAGFRAGGIPGALPLAATLAVAGFAVARTGKPYLAVLAGMPTFWLTTALTSL
jgi:branched chain amino acid efflux pump